LEAVLGPLFVFFAYNDVPSKWTLIGGSLLLCILAAHESMPLFEKSKEVYRTMSKRFSSKMSDGVVQDVQTTIELSKTNDDAQSREMIGDGADCVVEEDSFQLNEISGDSTS
jgi:hypothetical protein